MRQSIEFLKTRLNELYSKFSDIKIRYEYNPNTVTHIIEVIPLSFFQQDKEYMIFEETIEQNFEASFPSENILFISEDSLTEIINPCYKLGYDSILFYNEGEMTELVVEGYPAGVEVPLSNNYALAA
ncbi:MAG: hypothetical protein JXR34_01660 [Bacteroidales bacterium]|nr:hypothetical protein [Bacteroidales bacterium]